MQKLEQLVALAKAAYKKGSALDEIKALSACALAMLHDEATTRYLGSEGVQRYNVWEANGKLSRPIRDGYMFSEAEFNRSWDGLIGSADSEKHLFTLGGDEVNKCLYSAMSAVSVAYDLWKPRSRKTPGTVFEMVLGSVMQLVLPSYTRSSHVIIPNQKENVSTDIVFRADTTVNAGLVVPVKITTRERIVQAFAHQRILDSVFGQGIYRSILVCVSEMQRDKKNNVNAICVPGTIRLFQQYLAPMYGIYYLDPPRRYLQDDVTEAIHVGTVGALLTKDLPGLLASLKKG